MPLINSSIFQNSAHFSSPITQYAIQTASQETQNSAPPGKLGFTTGDMRALSAVPLAFQAAKANPTPLVRFPAPTNQTTNAPAAKAPKPPTPPLSHTAIVYGIAGGAGTLARMSTNNLTGTAANMLDGKLKLDTSKKTLFAALIGSNLQAAGVYSLSHAMNAKQAPSGSAESIAKYGLAGGIGSLFCHLSSLDLFRLSRDASKAKSISELAGIMDIWKNQRWLIPVAIRERFLVGAADYATFFGLQDYLEKHLPENYRPMASPIAAATSTAITTPLFSRYIRLIQEATKPESTNLTKLPEPTNCMRTLTNGSNRGIMLYVGAQCLLNLAATQERVILDTSTNQLSKALLGETSA